MRPGLKKELSLLCGFAAAYYFARKQPTKATLMTLASGSLLLSSFKPSTYTYFGKSVLITGGSRGLGLALAKQLVTEGAWVTLMARKADELHEAKQRLLEIDPQAQIQTVVCDVTQSDQLTVAISQAVARFGRLDVLINNAGAISVGPFAATERQDYEAQLKLHLFAVIEATRIVCPLFREQRGGKIINICSLGGRVSVPHMLPYGVSKFALSGFSQGITAELKREKIEVTTVYPALMQTGSPIQAVFKGDQQKEFSWFMSADNFPLLSMPADVAAEKILDGARNGETEVTLSVIGKARSLVAAFFPELMAVAMSLLARMLPHGTSKTYKTGAQSRASFDQNWALYPLRMTGAKAAQELNQKPSQDARFNLGLR